MKPLYLLALLAALATVSGCGNKGPLYLPQPAPVPAPPPQNAPAASTVIAPSSPTAAPESAVPRRQ